MAVRGHPVCRKLDAVELADVSRGDIGDRLGYGQAHGGGVIEQRHLRALADGAGLAAVAVIGRGRHADVRDRHLPGADHLIARDQARHRAIAYGN